MPATVRIESGCIHCQACALVCPQVFALPDDSDHAVVRGEAREDGITSDNLGEGSPLLPLAGDVWESVREAAAGCPVEIIRISGGAPEAVQA